MIVTKVNELTPYLLCVWAAILSGITLTFIVDSRATVISSCSVKHGIANCTNLNLSTIPSLPPDTKTLLFSCNSLKSVTRSTFAPLHNLQLEILNLNHCEIKHISTDAFNDLLTVKHLSLSGNHFKNFDDLMVALSKTRLHVLELADVREENKEKWNVTTFQPLSKLPLTELNLAENRITKISLTEINFSCLKNLTKLNLNDNNIFVFSLKGGQLPNIIELSLKGNQIRALSSLCRGRNESFRFLKFIDISKNAITELTKKSMNVPCLRNLSRLKMKGNRIVRVRKNVFTFLPSLTNLELDITSISSEGIQIDRAAFNSTSLKALNIAMNNRQLDIMNPKIQYMFSYCPNLKMLTIQYFKFSNYNESQISKLFSFLSKLKSLTIDHGPIIKIPSDLISNMAELEHLSFRGNHISSWNPAFFANAVSLKSLILSINQITHINEGSFPSMLWKNLTTLDLSYNPFDCTCELEWFRKYIKKNASRFDGFPKFYYCKSPTKWKDKRLEMYDPSYLECHHLGSLGTSLIVVGSFLLMAVVTVVVLHKYKWHIKHYIYLMRAKRDYQRIPDSDDFMYDAFVSYNTSDRIWVLFQLRPFLEEKHNIKLCLHERDFDPGKLIVDNITDYLKLSKKVILILSNNFAKSHWCQFEVLMIHNRFIEEGGSSLILLMMEDIRAQYVCSPLKLLLQFNTYIRWTNDRVGKQLFWNKLLAAVK